jgi:predicted component of type VI protein secretion system
MCITLADYELRGFKDVLEYAQEIVRMEPEIEKIIEYYED